MPEILKNKCTLTIIGTGMAGMAAACFASRYRMETIQVGVNSGLIYSSGYFDLMGVHPMETQMAWNNPWQAIDQLKADIPNHPYARLRRPEIKTAVKRFLDFMETAEHPLPVSRKPEYGSHYPRWHG